MNTHFFYITKRSIISAAMCMSVATFVGFLLLTNIAHAAFINGGESNAQQTEVSRDGVFHGKSADTPSQEVESAIGGKTQYRGSISDILKQIEDLKERIRTSGFTTAGTAKPPVVTAGRTQGQSCFDFTRPLAFGNTDNTTDGAVSKLQSFLARDTSVYPEAQVTGYFGPATQKAVERFQQMHDIVSVGAPLSTGFGSFGPRTHAVVAQMCQDEKPANSTHTPVSIREAKYDLKDVKTVTATKVNPSSTAVDDEYSLYTITLTDGTARTVKITGLMSSSIQLKLFKDTGYTGDVAKLRGLATKSGTDGSCTSATVTYPEGTKRQSIVLPNGNTSVVSDTFYLCTKGEWKISSGSISTSNSYKLSDVESITYQTWGKIVQSSTNQYHVLGKSFTITLLDGTVRKVYDNSIVGALQLKSRNTLLSLGSTGMKNIFTSGFTGNDADIKALLKKAVKVDTIDTTDIDSLPSGYVGSPKVNGAQITNEKALLESMMRELMELTFAVTSVV